MKVLITGANGFLASRISNYYRDRHGIYALTRQDVDFTDVTQLYNVFARINPEIVVHCGAVSNTEMCRLHPDKTWYSNVYGVGTVADACSQIDAKLIFCSSDQVYGMGDVAIPHKEMENLTPRSVYGEQKLSAEKLAMGRNIDTVCIRLSWMYDMTHREGEHGDFITSLVDRLEKGEPFYYPIHDYRGITDVWDIVKAMEKIWQLPIGIYNMGSENPFSTYELVRRFLAPYKSASGLLLPEEEAFREEPRNLRMDNTLIERYGLHFTSTLEKLNSKREQFEKLCEQRNVQL